MNLINPQGCTDNNGLKFLCAWGDGSDRQTKILGTETIDRSKALQQLILNYFERHLVHSDSVKAFPENDFTMTRGRQNAWIGLQLDQLAVQIARNMSIDRYLLTKCANIIQRRNSNGTSILKTANTVNIANLRGRTKSVHDVRSSTKESENRDDGADIQPIANDGDNVDSSNDANAANAVTEQSLVTCAAEQNNNGQ